MSRLPHGLILGVIFALLVTLVPGVGQARSATVTPVLPSGGAAPPALGSAAAVLMDYESGHLLYEHLGFVRRPPASTTKILTALIAARYGHLGRWITVSRAAAMTPGSRMGLKTGERLRLGDLLTGMLLKSGNDAAATIAQALAGSVSQFASDMNRTALQLGARASHFENPHGLPDPHHYSTAWDLARIARAALALSAVDARVRMPEATVTDGDGRVFHLTNTNRLLGVFPGADGVKTGTTSAAGRCLVASATRGGWRLLAVVLRSPDRFSESASLLAWGFRAFAPVIAAAPGQTVGISRRPGLWGRPFGLVASTGLRIVVPVSEVSRLRTRIVLERGFEWRRAGSQVGWLEVVQGARVLGRAAIQSRPG